VLIILSTKVRAYQSMVLCNSDPHLRSSSQIAEAHHTQPPTSFSYQLKCLLIIPRPTLFFLSFLDIQGLVKSRRAVASGTQSRFDAGTKASFELEPWIPLEENALNIQRLNGFPTQPFACDGWALFQPSIPYLPVLAHAMDVFHHRTQGPVRPPGVVHSR
jgi:hypothetical protein